MKDGRRIQVDLYDICSMAKKGGLVLLVTWT